MNRKANLEKIEEALDNMVHAKPLVHIAGEDITEYRIRQLFAAVNGLTKDLRTEIENEESD